MFILTHYASSTYQAQIRSSPATGAKQLYTASCTMGPLHAARAVVLKNFGYKAAATVRQVTDATEINQLVGDYFRSPQRKQVFDVYTFDLTAR
jgi:hypothetical protein